MKFKKKNGVISFVLSFIPGAAEMYMGLMKNGLSIMVTFAILVSVYYVCGFGGLAAMATAVEFFGIVHAWKTHKLYNDTAGKIEDRSFFEELKERKYLTELSVALIIACALELYDEIDAVVYSYKLGCTMSCVFKQEIMDIFTLVLLMVFGIVLFISEKKSKKLVKTLEYK